MQRPLSMRGSAEGSPQSLTSGLPRALSKLGRVELGACRPVSASSEPRVLPGWPRALGAQGGHRTPSSASQALTVLGRPLPPFCVHPCVMRPLWWCPSQLRSPVGPAPSPWDTGVRVSPHQQACVQPSHTHRYTWVHLHTLALQRRETPHPQSSLCPPRQRIVIGSQGMPPIDSLTRHNHSVTVATESSVSFITTCQPCLAAQRSPLRQWQRQQHVVPLMHQPRAHIPIPMGKSRVLARKKTTPHASSMGCPLGTHTHADGRAHMLTAHTHRHVNVHKQHRFGLRVTLQVRPPWAQHP